ncbi:hypothetical protein BD560DRAFT_494219 [Blakeslea trispora]|nr:hypothetical protein BD560DRAFT_494219 [Blakeslea trispora]
MTRHFKLLSVKKSSCCKISSREKITAKKIQKRNSLSSEMIEEIFGSLENTSKYLPKKLATFIVKIKSWKFDRGGRPVQPGCPLYSGPAFGVVITTHKGSSCARQFLRGKYEGYSRNPGRMTRQKSSQNIRQNDRQNTAKKQAKEQNQLSRNVRKTLAK